MKKVVRNTVLGGVGLAAVGAAAYLPALATADAATTNAAPAASTNDGTVSATDQATVTVINGGLSIKKTANKTTILTGQRVTFTYVVTATGADFTDINVTDNKCFNISDPVGPNVSNGVLKAGTSWTYTCSQTLTTTTTNIGTVTGTPVLSNGTPSPTPTVSTTATPSPTATGGLKDGTFTGAAATISVPGVANDNFTEQVQITVQGGQIVSVSVPVMTATNKTSVFLTNDANTTLIQETLTAQSANVAAVSGASYTSAGFVSSLQDALTQAKA